MDIQKLRRFLSNDFNNAILSIRKKDDDVVIRLTLREKSELNGNFIGLYSEDINLLKKNQFKLCDYMLEKFLNNNTIIGVKYFTFNHYHPNKDCFDIITNNGVFTIAIDKIDIKDIFPDFVKRLEFAKREGIIKQLKISNTYRKYMFLALSSSKQDISTFLGYSSYHILSIPIENNIKIPDYERKFVIRLIQEFLRMYQVTENCCFKDELIKLENFIDELKEKRGFYSLASREYSINGLCFEFYKDEKAIIQLKLIIEAIKGLEKEFKYHNYNEKIADFDKQLVIKNNSYGGRKYE